MKYTVLLDAMQNKARVIRCLNDADLLETCYNLIGCRTVENIILEPGRLPEGFVAFADEDIRGDVAIYNPLASWLHGTDIHGQPICNNVLIWKEIPEDVDFMTAEEARQIANDLNARAQEIFDLTMFKIMDTIRQK